MQKVLEIAERNQSRPYFEEQLANAINNLGGFYESIGEMEKAETYYTKWVALEEKGPEGDVGTVDTLITLGDIQQSQYQDNEGALKRYNQAIDNAKRYPEVHHPDHIAGMIQKKIDIYEAQGRKAETKILYEDQFILLEGFWKPGYRKLVGHIETLEKLPFGQEILNPFYERVLVEKADNYHSDVVCEMIGSLRDLADHNKTRADGKGIATKLEQRANEIESGPENSGRNCVLIGEEHWYSARE